MYEYIRGVVSEVDDGAIVLDVGGVGYRIAASGETAGQAMNHLSDRKPMTLFIEFVVKEDSHTLYGFLTKEGRALFRLLMNISGIGAKLATQIMNHGSREQILRAIVRRDVPWLSSISGIGKKMAERIGLEAGEKAEKILSLTDLKKESIISSLSCTVADEAVGALVSLGLSNQDARRHVDAAMELSLLRKEEVPDLSRLIHLSLMQRASK